MDLNDDVYEKIFEIFSLTTEGQTDHILFKLYNLLKIENFKLKLTENYDYDFLKIKSKRYIIENIYFKNEYLNDLPNEHLVKNIILSTNISHLYKFKKLENLTINIINFDFNQLSIFNNLKILTIYIFDINQETIDILPRNLKTLSIKTTFSCNDLNFSKFNNLEKLTNNNYILNEDFLNENIKELDVRLFNFTNLKKFSKLKKLSTDNTFEIDEDSIIEELKAYTISSNSYKYLKNLKILITNELNYDDELPIKIEKIECENIYADLFNYINLKTLIINNDYVNYFNVNDINNLPISIVKLKICSFNKNMNFERLINLKNLEIILDNDTEFFFKFHETMEELIISNNNNLEMKLDFEKTNLKKIKILDIRKYFSNIIKLIIKIPESLETFIDFCNSHIIKILDYKNLKNVSIYNIKDHVNCEILKTFHYPKDIVYKNVKFLILNKKIDNIENNFPNLTYLLIPEQKLLLFIPLKKEMKTDFSILSKFEDIINFYQRGYLFNSLFVFS